MCLLFLQDNVSNVFTCCVVFLFGNLAPLELLEGSSAVVSPRRVDRPSDCFPGYTLFSRLMNCG